MDVNICHARLGHIRQEGINRLANIGFLDPVGKIELTNYEHYVAEKITKKLFGKKLGLISHYN